MDIDLDAVQARSDEVGSVAPGLDVLLSAYILATESVPVLVAEVRRLRSVIERVEPILALLHYRGIVDTEHNRADDVFIVSSLSALSRLPLGKRAARPMHLSHTYAADAYFAVGQLRSVGTAYVTHGAVRTGHWPRMRGLLESKGARIIVVGTFDMAAMCQ